MHEVDEVVLLTAGIFIAMAAAIGVSVFFFTPIDAEEDFATITLKGYDTGGSGWYVETDAGRVDIPRDDFHKVHVGDTIVIRRLLMWNGNEYGLSYVGRI